MFGHHVYSVGSCFAEMIAGRLKRYLFSVVLNPYGIAYNPASVAGMLRPDWREPELFLHHGLWRSLSHHSELAWSSRAETLQLLANAERVKQHALAHSQWLLVTLGTSQAFHLPDGRVVANCHRLPQSLFQRKRLSVQQCTDVLVAPLVEWLEEEPSRQVILTVSPVRYLRDGLVENNRGKAALLLAAEAAESAHPRLVYFPAYEIVIDELRSYRYFERDLCHPNTLAGDIVWQRFVQDFMHNDCPPVFQEMEKLLSLLEHRQSSQTDRRAMGRKGLERLERLQQRQAKLDLSHWKDSFQAMAHGP